MKKVQTPASLKDGVSQSKVKGQEDKILRLNNPKGLSGLKQARKTGVIKQGTDYLRGKQNGN